MPKYRVSVTQTVVEIFEPSEVDAQNETIARKIVESMVTDDELPSISSESNYTTEVVLLS